MVLAVGDNNLWCSLHINSHSVCEVRVLNSSDGSLQLGVERHFGEDSTLFACHYFVHWDLSVLEPLNQGDFRAVADRDVERVLSHLNVSLRVVNNALDDLLLDVRIELAVRESVLPRVLDLKFLSVEAVHLHLLSSHSASLADANIGKQTCNLNRFGVAHEHVVVLAHLENASSERDLNSHGQAFWDGDNEHDESDHNVVNQLFCEFSTAYHVIDANLQEEHNHRRSKNDDG